MVALVIPFGSGKTLYVQETDVERYLAMGFERTKETAPEPEPTPKPRRRRTKPKE